MKAFRWGKRAKAVCAALLLTAALILSGGSREHQREETGKEDMYTLSQIMTIAATERNRYQKVYTSQIWEAVTDENGTTMKDMLLSQIRTFLEDLETMNRLALSKEITLSGAESDQIHNLAKQYYGELTEGDLAYIQVSQQEIERLYEKY